MDRAKYLMCRPTHFGVDYVINPWMENHIGAVDNSEAHRQWDGLYKILTESFGAKVELVDPQPGQPDMVFTANAGVILDGSFVPARFRHEERQGEEPYYLSWFESRGFDVLRLESYNEGAGDALFLSSGAKTTLFCGHGFRSDASFACELGEFAGVETVSVELVDPRFYHIDTCFCPLPGGKLMWFPDAFSQVSRRLVEAHVPAENRFAVGKRDAEGFACNAVAYGDKIVSSCCGAETREWLEGAGFHVFVTPLEEFLKAGGGAKCATLRLDTNLV